MPFTFKIKVPELEEATKERKEVRTAETKKKAIKKKKRITARSFLPRRIVMGLIIKNGYFIRALSKIEVYVLTEFYGRFRTFDDIGKELGVSRQRIKQLEQEAMWKLYKYLQDKKII